MNMPTVILQLAAVASGLYAVTHIALSQYRGPENTNRAYY